MMAFLYFQALKMTHSSIDHLKKQLPQNKSINQEEVSETQKSQVQHERKIRVAHKSSHEAGQGKKEAQSSSISNQKKRW